MEVESSDDDSSFKGSSTEANESNDNDSHASEGDEGLPDGEGLQDGKEYQDEDDLGPHKSPKRLLWEIWRATQ